MNVNAVPACITSYYDVMQAGNALTFICMVTLSYHDSRQQPNMPWKLFWLNNTMSFISQPVLILAATYSQTGSQSERSKCPAAVWQI